MGCGRSRTIISDNLYEALTLLFLLTTSEKPCHKLLLASISWRSAYMHIGKKIQEILRQHPKDHTVTWFARRLNCHRVNVYDIFSRQTIDTELLWRISVILDYNFFYDISEEFTKILKEQPPASKDERQGG